MSIKCSRCGKRFADIGAIGRHYRKAHPKVMASYKKKKGTSRTKDPKRMTYNELANEVSRRLREMSRR